MSLTTNLFILFLLLCLLFYYLVPKKFQWAVLLVCSYLYYASANVWALVFLLYTTIITFGGGMLIAQAQEKEAGKKVEKRILVGTLLLTFGMLGVLKYTNFVLENVNWLFSGHLSLPSWLLPLGISYYTLQSASYVLDVYWKRTTREANLFRYGLFVAFFPQLLQGPIGRFGALQPQLLKAHAFSLSNIKYGLERMLWGLFKIMLLAGWAGVYEKAIVADPTAYAGIAGFGVILYFLELYGNFSGGIDMVLGMGQLFGIQLEENFARPIFSASLAEYWRRWHITLGSWMKDYAFYPLTLSKAMKGLGKRAKKWLGKKRGRLLPICLSNIMVFLLVGLWHGTSWNQIGWGCYHGLLLALGEWFAEPLRHIRQKLSSAGKEKGYNLFCMAGTWVLVLLGGYFNYVDSFATAKQLLFSSLTTFHPTQFLLISSGKMGTVYTPWALLTLGVSVGLLLGVEWFQEKGGRVRQRLSSLPWLAQFGICAIFLVWVVILSPMEAESGFIYAQF